MKAEIIMDPATRAGILKISPETPIEAFALHHWWSNYDAGDRGSILSCQVDIPAPAQ